MVSIYSVHSLFYASTKHLDSFLNGDHVLTGIIGGARQLLIVSNETVSYNVHALQRKLFHVCLFVLNQVDHIAKFLCELWDGTLFKSFHKFLNLSNLIGPIF